MRSRPGTGHHALVRYASERLAQVGEQDVLRFVDRRKVGVPAFRRMHRIAVALPGQHADAEPGAGADHQARAVRLRHRALQCDHVVFAEFADPVADGGEIIDQQDVRDAQGAR